MNTRVIIIHLLLLPLLFFLIKLTLRWYSQIFWLFWKSPRILLHWTRFIHQTIPRILRLSPLRLDRLLTIRAKTFNSPKPTTHYRRTLHLLMTHHLLLLLHFKLLLVKLLLSIIPLVHIIISRNPFLQRHTSTSRCISLSVRILLWLISPQNLMTHSLMPINSYHRVILWPNRII